MIEPGRKFVQGVKKYRYGFNGKENDNEVKGEGSQQDYGMRINDPRLGRFLSEDPITKKYPELTPYQFASNRPIDGVDEDGLEYSPAGRSGIHQLATDASAVQHYTINPGLANKQIQEAPERQKEKARAEIRAQYSQLAKQPQASIGNAPEQLQWKTDRNKVLKQNYDLSHPKQPDFLDNKHFQKFAEHMALPLIEGAAGDGFFRVLGKAGSALFKVSKATTPLVEGGGSAITKFYPRNNGFLGATERTFLMPGEQISRYGSGSGKFLSPAGTPLPMRALPPGANTSILNTYKVLKPFEVEAGKIAPAFGKPGLGTQYLSPVSIDVLLKRGIIGH